jgi:hypothetical protein
VPNSVIVAPPLLLVVAAMVSARLAGVQQAGERVWSAASAWLAGLALVVIWVGLGGQAVGVDILPSNGPLPAALTLDAASLALGIALLVPVALLLTFQHHPRGQRAAALLTGGLALLAIESGSLALAALAIGSCLTVIVIASCQEEVGVDRGRVARVVLPVLILLAAVAGLELASGGTSAFDAVPPQDFEPLTFFLMAVAAVLCTGLLPWLAWPLCLWRRPRGGLAGMAPALVMPLGFLLLWRAYALGGGAWPGAWPKWVLIAWAAVVASSAAIRAQAAADRRQQLAEMAAVGTGLAWLALALGTPLGLAAAMTGVLATGLGAVLGALLPGGGRVTVLGIPLVAGMPVGLAFGARLLTTQAALEAGPRIGLLVLLIGAIWLLGYAAAARTASLPPGPGQGSRAGMVATAAILLLTGAGLGGLEQLVALPAAGAVMSTSAAPITGGGAAVLMASGGFGALWVSLPLLALLMALTLLTGPLQASRPVADLPPPPPLPARLPPHLARGAGVLEALLAEISNRVKLLELERRLSAGQPVIWVGAIALLALIVAR